jgi:hypothetical protein
MPHVALVPFTGFRVREDESEQHCGSLADQFSALGGTMENQ